MRILSPGTFLPVPPPSSSPSTVAKDETQWNAFVEILPLWLAPNMVTLIGFLFILVNIVLLVIFMPDLVGPVRLPPTRTTQLWGPT